MRTFRKAASLPRKVLVIIILMVVVIVGIFENPAIALGILVPFVISVIYYR